MKTWWKVVALTHFSSFCWSKFDQKIRLLRIRQAEPKLNNVVGNYTNFGQSSSKQFGQFVKTRFWNSLEWKNIH